MDEERDKLGFKALDAAAETIVKEIVSEVNQECQHLWLKNNVVARPARCPVCDKVVGV